MRLPAVGRPVLRPVSGPGTAPGWHCSGCHLSNLCLPAGREAYEVRQLDGLVYTRRRIPAGEALYHAGVPSKSVFAVWSGFFKSSIISEEGRIQVTGFQMEAEMMGLESTEGGVNSLNVVALTDSEVCVIPHARLEEVSARVPWLRQQIHRVLSREIVSSHRMMMLLGTMRAEERVAAFLLAFSHRLVVLGHSSSEFDLRMGREDLASYLGLTLETVSRILSKFDARGLLEVRKRLICILSRDGLKSIVNRIVRTPTAPPVLV